METPSPALESSQDTYLNQQLEGTKLYRNRGLGSAIQITAILLFVLYAIQIWLVKSSWSFMIEDRNDRLQDFSSLELVQNLSVVLDGLGGTLHFIFNILIIIWTYRAYANLHASGLKYLKYRKIWGWLAWFVPILNFFRVPKIVSEIWTETPEVSRRKNRTLSQLRSSLPIVFWWTLYLAMTFFALRVVIKSTSITDSLHYDNPAKFDSFMLNSMIFMSCAACFYLVTFIIVRISTKDQQQMRLESYFPTSENKGL